MLPLSSAPDPKIKIVTYNVLNPCYSNPSCLPHGLPESTDNEWRFQTICKKLRLEAENDSIICLQELNAEWSGRFHVWFANCGYRFITRLYGTVKNQFMGVGIAFPIDKYQLLNLHTVWPPNTVEYPQRQPTGWLEWLLAGGTKTDREVEDEYLDSTKWRKNEAIVLRLTTTHDSLPPFVVATYHMPCDFKNIDRMILYAGMVSRAVYQLKRDGDSAVFLAGDFNVQPDSEAYHVFRHGPLYVNHLPRQQHPRADQRGERFKRVLASVLGECPVWQSAYFTNGRSEPKFTVSTHSEFSAEPFHGTLDYIWFLSVDNGGGVTVDSVKYTYDDDEFVEEPLLPSIQMNQPSDHLLLSATFLLGGGDGDDDGGVQ